MALVALAVVYAVFNPAEYVFFPRCPFKLLTGLDCPGCGSQRAVHNLLRFNIGGALRENILLVVFIPYLITSFIFDSVKDPSPRMAVWRKRLFGIKAIWVVLAVILVFWVLRNIPLFAEYI